MGSAFAENAPAVLIPTSCQKPSYPKVALSNYEEGTVQLKFLVDVAGNVTESAIEESSGFKKLDVAAKNALAKCKFTPASVNGVVVKSWTSIKYSWRLESFQPCGGVDVSKWHYCFGSLRSANGEVKVGDFIAGKLNGLGVEYSSAGAVLNSGVFKNGAVISKREVDLKRYPFEQVNEVKSEIAINNDKQLPNTQLESEAAITKWVNRKALVIGNDSYKSVSKLFNAREDAKAIASNLIAVGYQVTLKLDVDEKEMKAALRTFANQVQGGDEVMFFFAGHGVQLGAANYLLPTDIGGESEAQIRDEAVQLQRILNDMSDKKAKFTLAMVDACRDNPFKGSGRNLGGRGLAPTTAATGQMVVFSAEQVNRHLISWVITIKVKTVCSQEHF